MILVNVCDFNKVRFVDCIWQSRKPVNADVTIREIVANSIFSPISIYFSEINSIIESSQNENEVVRQLFDLYNTDQAFRDFVGRIEITSKERLEEYLYRYSGYTSFVAWVLMNSNFEGKEKEIKEQLLKWYVESRLHDDSILSGSVIFNAIDLGSLLFEIFKDLVITLFGNIVIKSGKFAVKESKRLIHFLKETKKNKINNFRENTKIPESFLMQYLYIFDLSESEITGFEEKLFQSMFELLRYTNSTSLLLLLESLNNAEIYFDIEDTNLEPFLVSIETDNGLVRNVIDPVLKSLLHSNT